MKERNLLSGIIIADLISFISFVIFPYPVFFFFGDLQILIGVLWGTYFALKYLKKRQKFIRYGLGVGLGASFLSAISIFVFLLTLLFLYYNISLEIIITIVFLFLIEAFVVGIIAGPLVGLYFYLKEGSKKELNATEEEFYNSLKEL